MELETYDIKEKKKYTQKWHEYNLSQTSEKLMFMDILRDICNYIRYNKPRRKGRPSLDLSEMIYCMCMLIYSGKSSRRIISELHISKDRNLISKVPHFNSVLNYFNNTELTKQLQALIQLSSYPLKPIEEDFAVDSSGFSTSIFDRWFNYKWGKHEGKERVWRKAHVMSGVKTNIVTSIEITKCHTADTTQFKDLVDKTDKLFDMREVSADKAYSSRSNLAFVSDLGAIPYIPFRKNTTGKRARGAYVWGRMFRYFKEHREEFMEHYHKRSNAETVFSMIKKKFGMNLRTKTELSQTNEILCKFLCHNICVLITETFELGISTEFEEHYTDVFCAGLSSAQEVGC